MAISPSTNELIDDLDRILRAYFASFHQYPSDDQLQVIRDSMGVTVYLATQLRIAISEGRSTL